MNFDDFYCKAIKCEVKMTKVAIVGYGNLGKACEGIAVERKDFDLVGIFTRRNPASMISPYNTRFFSQQDLIDCEGEIDVLVLCTGSKNDLVPLACTSARHFNTVDSFDNHNEMRGYVAKLDHIAKDSGHLSIVGAGWDPGVFSLMRGLFEGVTGGKAHTFWGVGVSQGHSEAVRGLDGVKNAVQYTIPNEDVVKMVKAGGEGNLTPQDKHKRVCYVVLEDGADKCRIEEQIKSMPDYFLGYETDVYFVDQEELTKNHSELCHGGQVLCSNNINGKNATIDFTLKLQSNPNFTASVMMSYAKCVDRLYNQGERGAKTILDIPITALFEDRLDTMGKYL